MHCNHSFYCRLTSPLLLIALSVAGGGCLFISYKNQGKKIQVLGGKLIVIYDVIYCTLSNSPELTCNFLDNIVTFLLFCMGRRLSQTKKHLCLNFTVNVRLKNYSNFSEIPKIWLKFRCKIWRAVWLDRLCSRAGVGIP